jgi:hypothetical protein
MDLLVQQSRDVGKRLSIPIQAGNREAINIARSIAEQVSRNISENTPNELRAQLTELSVLAKSNMVVNSSDAMHSVNWFMARKIAERASRNASENTPDELRVSPWNIAISLR